MARYEFWDPSNSDRLQALKDNSLFRNRLLPDIKQGDVFPAMRKRKIDFYFRGRKLCSFDGGEFRANIAYLAAFEDRPKGEIKEEEFRNLRVCSSFESGYPQIKKNIELHEQPESGGVFSLCRAHSLFNDSYSGPVGVLDVELSIEALDNTRSQDRIDLVLFHGEQKELRFFEVKTFRNKEIWPNEDNDVDVDRQIGRYRDQLTKRKSELLEGYQEYVSRMSFLLDVALPTPGSLDLEPDLLLIDFDGEQQKTINEILLPAFKNRFRCCLIGDPKRATAATLEKWWKNRAT
ncbi:hypothetical protein LOC68_09355 [Blastopirellula sp. JC732]|uniref:Uncharacterized protein n=1 Tax=Blastopirellula sediminis TaxID=2894196 RepID=A0A9X1SFQ7_9BACT|nr:hypothetical protein [Blastopirellula sediminis]MCC9608620.1 hypothetical protein [Blastopirellula sediminis]MCC9628603.1 hypothetical protein [Blastopirellula sediminis]